MKYFAAKALSAAAAAAVLFFICFSLAVGTDSNTADSTTAYNLSTWLAKNDIIIDRELIDTDMQYVAAATMQNAVADHVETADAVLGGASGTGADTYTGENGTLAFSRDSFVLTPSEGLFASMFSGIDRYNCGRHAESAAEELGFNLNGSVISSEEGDSVFTSVITKTIDSLPVFDDCITLVMSRDGLVSAAGVWYTLESKGDERPAKSSSDALAELLNSVGGAGRVTVRSMELGYLMEHTGNITELKPVWRFELDGRDDFYIDA